MISVSQRGVQLVIGKLLTDEAFRRRFEERGGGWLAHRLERSLSRMEIAALMETNPRLWSRMAKLIHPGLQKVGAKSLHEGPSAREPLTVRQQEVLRGICDGLTNKQIATEIGVSESAVKATLQQLFRKTRVRTRVQLVRIALEDSFGT